MCLRQACGMSFKTTQDYKDKDGPCLHSFKDSRIRESFTESGAHLVAAQAPSGQVWALLQQCGLHRLDLLNVLLTGYCLGGQAVLNLQGALGRGGRGGLRDRTGLMAG